MASGLSSIEWSVTKTSGSTLEVATKLAAEGAHQGTVVRSNASSRLEICAVLTPSRRNNLQLLQVLAPYTAAEGIRKDTGIVAWLRWPRWATVDEKVLAEGSTLVVRRGPECCVLMLTSVNSSSAETEDSTSLLSLLGVRVDHNLLMERILGSLNWIYSAWLRGMDGHIRARIEPTLESIGSCKPIRVRGSSSSFVASGLGEDGSLELKSGGGRLNVAVGAAERVRYVR